MGALKRAARYLARKPGKAALLVVVVFATSLAVMASVGIIEGARDLSHAIKEGSRPSVAVYREDGELLPFVVAGDLSNRDDVASANRTGQVDAFPASFSSIEAAVPDPGWDDAVRIHALDDLSQGSPFEDGSSGPGMRAASCSIPIWPKQTASASATRSASGPPWARKPRLR